MKATIIGAGIGGLTLVIALQKQRIESEIYESFSSFKEMGAGIMLAGNAMKVYSKLGIADELIQNGNVLTRMNITDHQLKILSSVTSSKFSSKNHPTVALHRSVLQKVLLNKVPKENIHLGKKVELLQKKGNEIEIQFSDQDRVKADIVLGADGIHSKVRSFVTNNITKRDAGQICWRGISNYDLPENLSTELNEMWGRGKRFGFVKIQPNKVYWYALLNESSEIPLNNNSLLEYFRDFHPIAIELIDSTQLKEILENKIIDLKPFTHWSKGNVCLMGDAAHATTPNLGQGACQAVEDAFVLAQSLSTKKNHQDAFKLFQSYRMKVAHQVVQMSWRMGKIAHVNNPLLVSLRNYLMKMMPSN